MVPQTKVFVGSLPQGSKPEDLRKLFERYGEVTECDIMNRCGFVHMQTEDQAAAAIRALHNATFNGGVITVERGRIKERGQRGGGGGRGGPRGRGMGRGMGRGRGGRDAPYSRDRAPRPPPYMRNGMQGYGQGGYEQPAYDDGRYAGAGGGAGYGEDRRGFSLVDARRDAYPPPPVVAPPHAHYDERRPYDDPPPAYDDRRAGYGPPEMDRRGLRPLQPYERLPRAHNGDMFSRRSPAAMRGGGGGGPMVYDRDPYVQQYPPMGRGGRDMSGGPRRY